MNSINQSTGVEPLSYTWDFGYGVGTSTETNPSCTFANIGMYNVTLYASNPYGTDQIMHPVLVVPVAYTSVDLTFLGIRTILPGDVADYSAEISPGNAGKPYV